MPAAMQYCINVMQYKGSQNSGTQQPEQCIRTSWGTLVSLILPPLHSCASNAQLVLQCLILSSHHQHPARLMSRL